MEHFTRTRRGIREVVAPAVARVTGRHGRKAAGLRASRGAGRVSLAHPGWGARQMYIVRARAHPAPRGLQRQTPKWARLAPQVAGRASQPRGLYVSIAWLHGSGSAPADEPTTRRRAPRAGPDATNRASPAASAVFGCQTLEEWNRPGQNRPFLGRQVLKAGRQEGVPPGAGLRQEGLSGR